MKSNKQRRQEIKQHRVQRAKKQAKNAAHTAIPKNALKANHAALSHNTTYSPFPLYYIDKPFTCKDCGKAEVWTAAQQQWWYEQAKGCIDSTAVRCRACRTQERARKVAAREQHLAGLARKYGSLPRQ